MQTVIETYISCRDQQINGRVYSAGEVVPGADALRTLPALLKTNRLRLATRLMETEAESVDLGSAQAKPAPKPQRRRRSS